MLSRRCQSLTLIALGWITTACGQKGPPLAPLHLVPASVSEPTARRIGDKVRLRFVLPNRNENGPGPLELERVEIYAMTVNPDAEPSPQEVMSGEHRIGQIGVRPVLEEGQQHAPGESRPEPGTPVTFDEELTPATLKPVPVKTPVKPAAPPAAAAKPPVPTPPAAAPPTTGPPTPAPPATAPPSTAPPAGAAPPKGQAPATAPAPGPPAAAAPAAPARTHRRRIYMARGVTRRGRPGAASPQMSIPLADLPLAPQDFKARVTENAVVLEWGAVESVTGYNVFLGDDVVQPINNSALTAPTFEHSGVAFGQEQCFRVRSIALVDGVSLEGEPSKSHCVTARDEFPPAVPRGLAAVPTAGQISLIWDANTEKDLAGYLVLRGNAPDGPLTAITPAPIRETSYRDTAITPGTRYIYAVVAVDNATPPNMSAQSERVEETAR